MFLLNNLTKSISQAHVFDPLPPARPFPSGLKPTEVSYMEAVQQGYIPDYQQKLPPLFTGYEPQDEVILTEKDMLFLSRHSF